MFSYISCELGDWQFVPLQRVMSVSRRSQVVKHVKFSSSCLMESMHIHIELLCTYTLSCYVRTRWAVMYVHIGLLCGVLVSA